MKCLILLLFLSFIIQCSGDNEVQQAYLGEEPPSTTPKIFGKGIISTKDNIEFGITISSDGKELFFTRRSKGTNQNRNYHMIYSDSKWSMPQIAPFSYGSRASEPNFTPDGQTLFFNSRRPLPPGIVTNHEMNVWMVQKNNGKWGEPELLGSPVSDIIPMFVTQTNSGTLYTTGNVVRGIYRIERKNGEYQVPERLPDEINSQNWAGHPYIAPDESYIIYDANMDNEGNKNLFINFRQSDGSWGKAINVSKHYNLPEHSWCPFVSFDGKYFFFSARKNEHKDIYWVEANILYDLKEEIDL